MTKSGYEMRLRPLLLAFLSVFTVSHAYALERPFPVSAKRGTMTPAAHPQILIEGKSRSLAPGARIWNEENLIQMPASLRGGNFTVNYTEDADGAIDRVWILSAEEARQPITKQTNSGPR